MTSKSLEKTRQYYQSLIKTEPFLKALADFKVRWGFDKENFSKPDYWEVYKDAKKVFVRFGLNIEFCRVLIVRHIHEKVKLEDLPVPNLLCYVEDKLGPYSADLLGGIVQIATEAEETHPLVLNISPYATKRDLLNYIENEYTKSIKPIQDYYKSKEGKLGKLKKTNPIIRERNNFIFENRDKPVMEIQHLVRARYKGKLSEKQLPDVGAIRKIISLETKLRKEVYYRNFFD